MNLSRLFSGKLNVINLGLSQFAETLQELEIPVINVDWRPPADGDQRVLEALEKLNPGLKV